MIKKIYLALTIIIVIASISAQLSDLEQNIYDVFGVTGNEVCTKSNSSPETLPIDIFTNQHFSQWLNQQPLRQPSK